jgi:uncharacterized protein (DUF427 family)
MPPIKQTNLAPGQESVWDYPRPPRVENCARRIRVIFDGIVIADSTNSKRLLETSHPPVYYIPPEDVRMELLVKSPHNSFCEWKGAASYYSIKTEKRSVEDTAWCYHSPNPAYAVIKDHLAFYASRVDECFVDEERVEAQSGDFYGGWITKNIVGPFKGEPGSWGW